MEIIHSTLRITKKEANHIYRQDCLEADTQYHKECQEAYIRKEAEYTKAAQKRMRTKTSDD